MQNKRKEQGMTIAEKLEILTDAAKYDVACTSSGVDRGGRKGKIGSATAVGICHTFAADGRCISLLKVLLSNACAYDCAYCQNRRSNDIRRASFAPRELADLTIGFYRRNYIEGLFLSSGVLKNPDYTTELMIEALRILREEYGFLGYIHAKAIPGADPALTERLGYLADRMSVNIELPSRGSLQLLAPDKKADQIFSPMEQIRDGMEENRAALVKYRRAPKFVPAGQSTQMIIGASGETDYQILSLSAGLYKKYKLKRVFFSAYIPVVEGKNLPSLDTKPPLLREHRLYQADWLLRFYGFDASELLSEKTPNFNPYLDPKCNWAVNHMELFPLEINRCPYEMLLRIPGIGVRGAGKIYRARKMSVLDFEDLRRMGIVLKRAKFFITCKGKTMPGVDLRPQAVLQSLISGKEAIPALAPRQLSLFEPSPEDLAKSILGQL